MFNYGSAKLQICDTNFAQEFHWWFEMVLLMSFAIQIETLLLLEMQIIKKLTVRLLCEPFENVEQEFCPQHLII
jgi:hypothetical protein